MMNHRGTQAALYAAAVLSAPILAPHSASAAMISDWSYTVNSGFSGFQPSGVVASNANSIGVGTASTLRWGTAYDDIGEDRSSISVTPRVSTDETGARLKTNGQARSGASFIHDNEVILAGSGSLTNFTLGTQLDLTAGGGAVEQSLGPIQFDGFFKETTNKSDCGFAATSVCDDIFVLTNADRFTGAFEGGSFAYDQHFTVDDYRYTVTLAISGLGRLSDTQCGIAGADNGCFGFQTAENDESKLESQFRISAVAQVPEPGSLVLLGLGLIGICCARGRFAQQAVNLA